MGFVERIEAQNNVYLAGAQRSDTEKFNASYSVYIWTCTPIQMIILR